jgi:predicted phosphoribosyltransferase
MPVAAAVAKALDTDLDFMVARKLAAPESAELAIGAVTADGGRYLNEELIRELAVSPLYVERVTQVAMTEAKRRAQLLRGGGTAPRISGRIVLLIDDGLATGATMIAAARAVRAQHPTQLIIAAPVSSRAAFKAVKKEADIVECLTTPSPFWAVGAHYRSTQQTEDADVELLLHDARERRSATHAAAV